MKKHILVVEDDILLSSKLRNLLSENLSCQVDLAFNLQQAQKKLHNFLYSVVIVDRGLPDGDGKELLSIPCIGVDNQFLFLSSHNRLLDREAGMIAGAVDYLGKPFSSLELIIKVRRLLKHHPHLNSDLIRVDQGFVFSPSKRRLIIDGHSTKLSDSDTKLLEIFIQNHDLVVTRDAIRERLWQNQFISENAINARIYRLRAKLGRFSKTLRAHYLGGYQLNLTTTPSVITKIT